MNWEYVKTFLTQASFSSQQDVVVKGKISKDVANAVTVLYHGNVTPPPQSTFHLEANKERSHPESPQTMYDNPQWPS